MTTRINVTVDDGGLLDRNAQQQAANRQGYVVRNEQNKAATQGEAELQQRRTAEGRDPAAGQVLPSRGSRIRRIDQEPAAFRYGGFIQIGAVIFKYNTPSINFFYDSETENYRLEYNGTITLELGDYRQNQSTVFTIEGIQLSFDLDVPESDPGPSPTDGGVYTQDEYDSIPLSRTRYDFIEARTLIDKTFHFIVPDGSGGAYFCLHINKYVHASGGINAETKTAAHSLSYMAHTPYIVDGQPSTTTRYEWWWEFNPEGYPDEPYRIATYDPASFPDGPPEYLNILTAQIRTSISYSQTYSESQTQNELHVFHVTANGVAKITAPSTLLDKLNQTKGIATPNKQSDKVETAENYDTTWDGEPGPFFPSGNYAYTYYSSSEISVSYPDYDATTDTSGFGAVGSYSTDLLYYAGGLPAATTARDLKAWGLSFMLALNNVQKITDEQSKSYSYMISNVFKKRPKLLVSACVNPLSCLVNGTIDWEYTATLPVDIDDRLVPALFSTDPRLSVTLPPYAVGTGYGDGRYTGYTVQYYTDWGDAKAAKQIASVFNQS